MDTTADVAAMTEQVIEVLKTCYDPEIPVDIYEMGLIYDVNIDPAGSVEINMTLTSPHCPAAASLPSDVQARVSTVPGVTDVRVAVVWDPTWTPDMMSEAAKLQLGML